MSNPQQHQRHHQDPRRWYVMLVTSLAAMLLCLVFAYETVTVYTVESVVARQDAADRGTDQNLERVAASLPDITSAPLVRRAIDELDIRFAAVENLQGESSVDDLVQRLCSALSVTELSSSKSERHLFAVRYRGSERDVATAVVDQLAQQYVAAQEPAVDDAGLSLATPESTESQEAEERVRRARQELDEFIADHFERLRQLPWRTVGEGVTDAETANSSSEDSPGNSEMYVNPEWSALDQQITQKEEHLESLVRERTATHPEVRALSAQLATLRRELFQLPKQIEPPPGLAGGGDSSAAAETGSSSPVLQLSTPLPLDDWSQQSELLLAALADAERQRELVIVSERSRPQVAARNAVNRTWMHQPGRVVEQQTYPRHPTRLLWMCGASVGLGLFVCMLAGRGKSAPATIDTSADAEAALSLPVVGTVLRSNQPVRRSSRQSRGRLPTLCTRASELTIAMFLLLFLISSFSEGGGIQRFLRDPTAAVSQAFTTTDQPEG